MEYVCKVGTPAGDVVEKTFTAPDEATLRSELTQQGYYLFGIRRGMGVAELALKRRRIPNGTLLVFAQELAALLKAGLPLLQSLDVMLERQTESAFRRSLATIRDRVRSGASLSDALKAEGDLYPPIFGASLVAGERSGSLETVLRRFAQYVRLNQAVKKKAVSASIYPLVLLAMMLVLVSILLVVVIPQFQDFYRDVAGGDLPGVTRVLMTVAGWARGHLLWIVVGLAGSVLAAVTWLRQEGSGLLVDRFLLRLPYLGRMVRMYATTQLARTLSTLLSGGLPLVNALEVAGSSIGNRAVARAVTQATPQIREGRSLTAALESTGILDNIALEMVKVGEQTGALAEMLNSLAEFYDEELDTRMAAAMALVEPIMLALMAVIVAGMLLAFYLPLFEVFSKVRY